jgi:hypothetical protein
MSIEFPETKTTKDAIRLVIGRDVDFVFKSFTACVTCSGLGYYDEINQSSLNSFCPVCSGVYWISAESEESVRRKMCAFLGGPETERPPELKSPIIEQRESRKPEKQRDPDESRRNRNQGDLDSRGYRRCRSV